MMECTGITALDTEGLRHWDPAVGLWEPHLRRVNHERATVRPCLAPAAVAASRAAPLPDASILWRGSIRPGDSMGNLTYETMAALARLGVSDRVVLRPLRFWPEGPSIATDGDPKARLVEELLGRPEVPAGLELHVPGLAAPARDRCVRFLFQEFGCVNMPAIADRDIIWTPTRLIADRIERAYPRATTIAVPHGIDPAVFHPPTAPERRDTFRFLFVGTTISRKGFDLVWEAFRRERAHMPDAELVLKLFPTGRGFVWKGVQAAEDRVRVVDRVMNIRDVAALMRTCDVLVAPSRAEAFGLPVLEAMACGLPVIVPTGSAMDEFCPDEARFSIEADEVTLAGRVSFLEPSLPSLQAAMRQAYDDRAQVRRRGEAAAAIASRLTWDAVTRTLLVTAWKAQ